MAPVPVTWEREDHTEAKHDLLLAFFNKWVSIHSESFAKRGGGLVRIYDGFAGPGVYSGGEPGSPLILIRALCTNPNLNLRWREVRYELHFVEKDPGRARMLEQQLQDFEREMRDGGGWTDRVEWSVTCGRYEDNVPQPVRGNSALFLFLDPFGYSHAPMTLTQDLIQQPKSDTLIFLPLSFVHRFADREGQDKALDRLRENPVAMAQATSIEWTEATWNPVTGCSEVSPGCAHCYAKVFAERWRGVPGHPYEQGFDLRLWPERLETPLQWRKPKTIFVNSMSDLFHEDIPLTFVEEIFHTMRQAHWHTFQILTKRHERMADLAQHFEWPRNVWMGVTIENRRFVHRADALRTVPSAVRFISAEPLLGPLEGLDLEGIDWLIAGGESGPRHRRIDAAWVRDLRTACRSQGTAFFFKQWGGHRPKSNGRELDGRIWSEYPEPKLRTLVHAYS